MELHFLSDRGARTVCQNIMIAAGHMFTAEMSTDMFRADVTHLEDFGFTMGHLIPAVASTCLAALSRNIYVDGVGYWHEGG